mgnify:CR=1 FL=1
MSQQALVFLPILIAALSLGFAGWLFYKIQKQPVENQKAKEISGFIQEGAMAFLDKEYRILAVFVIIVTVIIALVPVLSWKTAVCFFVGALFSIIAGNIGMRVATIANVRTAESAAKGLYQGLQTAFSSGSVMGLAVVGLGLLGVTVLALIFKADLTVVYGFGFGASSVALFARVGGGIYTKAADVGADLVGKVEAGIPEDDPRNPAVIADNVGDNVGDVAGMGADLFESYVDSIIAAMVLASVGGLSIFSANVALPLIIAGVGILASIAGNFIIKYKKRGSPSQILNYGIWGAALIMAAGSFLAVYWLKLELGVYWSILVGLLAGVVIGLVTEYYTSEKNKPAQEVAKASETGPATNIIAGLALGLISTVVPVLTVCLAIFLAYRFANIYGIAIAAVGMLSTLGITLASDAYGPVADNAAGIAEMAGMGGEVRTKAETLDALGNTTAAIGKGFAIGSAALTALILLISFGQAVNIEIVNVLKPQVLIGVFIGGLLPCVFSALSMKAVGRAAYQMVTEVRRQFKEIPGLLEGTGKADYKRCIEISTGAALKKMIAPGLIAVLAPVAVGLLIGSEALAGMLVGSTVVGFILAVLMANAGGAWDNAKKYIEAGNLGGKGSPVHKAAIVGDTVGDPFKDTSGPSLNILIKLMAIVSIVIAPLLVSLAV